MYVVRLKATGKFLKKFSGSFNMFCWKTVCKLRPGRNYYGYKPTEQESDDFRNAMFCCETPNNAKIYLTERGARASVDGYDVEIVPVLIETKGGHEYED